MLEVIQVGFEKVQSRIGRLVFTPLRVTPEEALTQGYYLLHPVNAQDPICGDVLDPTWKATQIDPKGEEPYLRKEFLGTDKFCDWFLEATRKDLSDDVKEWDHAHYANQLSSSLTVFNTIQFAKALPRKPSEMVKLFRKDTTYVITKRTNYDDILKLALSLIEGLWEPEFIRNLIYRASGQKRMASGRVMASFHEARAMAYRLRPKLKGTIHNWADFNKIDLVKTFQPEHFKDLDDVVVQTVMENALFSQEAFFSTFCTTRPHDKKIHVLSWDYWAPKKIEGKADQWVAHMSYGGKPWQLDTSGSEAILHPKKGRTIVEVRKQMKEEGMDPRGLVPYRMDWKQFETDVKLLYPETIETGVQIVTDVSTVKAVRFMGCTPLKEISGEALGHLLADYGQPSSGSKGDQWKRFSSLMKREYKSFAKAMLRSMGTNRLFRVALDPVKEMVTLESVLAPKHPRVVVLRYMLSIYCLLHMRSNTILDPVYQSPFFTIDGAIEELMKKGYAQEREGKGKSAKRKGMVFATSGTEFPDEVQGVLMPIHVGTPKTMEDTSLQIEGNDLFDEISGG
jgi:hypothetical protein